MKRDRLNPDERREYLAMAERRSRRGSGTHADVLREQTSAYGVPDFAKHLGSVRFVLVGGIATRLYMPERMTLDVDVLIRPGELDDAERQLRESGCARVGPLTVGGSTWRLPEGSVLDVLALDEPWVEKALAHTVRGPEGLPCITLPFLVVMKLASGRVQDLADITRMLGQADGRVLEKVRAIVEEHRPGDMEDLESMIRLGRLEYEEEDGEMGKDE